MDGWIGRDHWTTSPLEHRSLSGANKWEKGKIFSTTLFLRGRLGMELSSKHTFSIFVSNFCERMLIYKIDWGRHKWLWAVIMLAGQPNWRLCDNPSKTWQCTRTQSQLCHGKHQNKEKYEDIFEPTLTQNKEWCMDTFEKNWKMQEKQKQNNE